MKKILLFVLSLSLILQVLILIRPSVIFGYGEDCKNQGGECTSHFLCKGSKKNIGKYDCEDIGSDSYTCCKESATPPPGAAGSGQSPLGGGNCTSDQLNTAIGCIDITNSTGLIGFILKWAIGIGGGVAFLLILYSSFMIMTSQGVPERLKAGQELLTSAIMGLILLIFSVFLLRLVGVNILNIPGFST